MPGFWASSVTYVFWGQVLASLTLLYHTSLFPFWGCVFHTWLGPCLQPTVTNLSSVTALSLRILEPGTSPDLLHSVVKNKKQIGTQPSTARSLRFEKLFFLCFLIMSSGMSPICKIINFLYLLFLMNLHIQLSFYLISHGFVTFTKTF